MLLFKEDVMYDGRPERNELAHIQTGYSLLQ
jgi:hypothetical protein